MPNADATAQVARLHQHIAQGHVDHVEARRRYVKPYIANFGPSAAKIKALEQQIVMAVISIAGRIVDEHSRRCTKLGEKQLFGLANVDIDTGRLVRVHVENGGGQARDTVQDQGALCGPVFPSGTKDQAATSLVPL